MATLVHLPHHRSCDPLHLTASMEAMDTQDPCKLEESLSGEGTMIELHTAFDMLDRNSDGHVYVEDIHDMMKALGHHDIDKDHVKDFIKNAANGSHSIREDEFISWMQKLDSKQHSDDYIILKGAFETFDKNKDGYISKAELKEGLLLIGEDVSDRTLDLMMQEADKDRDGLINFEDFAQVMA